MRCCVDRFRRNDREDDAMIENQITDPTLIEQYVQRATRLYDLSHPVNQITLAEPRVVVLTATGAKVMAWLIH